MQTALPAPLHVTPNLPRPAPAQAEETRANPPALAAAGAPSDSRSSRPNPKPSRLSLLTTSNFQPSGTLGQSVLLVVINGGN